MRHSQMRKRRVIAALLTTCFLLQQSMIIPAMASEIGGSVDGWVAKGENGVFDINATAATISGIGFRKYEKFNLSPGDVANLMFRLGIRDIHTFVNLVDEKININGIVNSMRDGNFYNGKAVFVSPNGMVVGASGVLNVGSLSVLTPTQSAYESFRDKPAVNLEPLYTQGNGVVEINGKIFTQDGVEINAGALTVGSGAGIMSGVSGLSEIASNTQATRLFNELVNTDNLAAGSALTNENGSIVIKAYNANGNGVDISGNVKNFGTGNVDIINSGSGVKVASTGKVSGAGLVNVENAGANGVSLAGLLAGNNVNVDNAKGAINVANTGNVKANENVNFTNNGTGGIIVYGNVNGKNVVADNKSGAINVASGGTVKATQQVTYTNIGNGGVVIDGTTKGDKVLVDNSAAGISVGGTVDGATQVNLNNTGADGVTVSGSVNGGNIYVDNTNGGITIADKGKMIATSLLSLINTGANGITVNGTAQGAGCRNKG